MKLRVTVTQEDIDNGVRTFADRCAIANAINRLFERRMTVCSFGICDNKPVTLFPADVLFTFPKNVLEWIERFDEGQNVEPITFEIQPIERPEAVKAAEEMASHLTAAL